MAHLLGGENLTLTYGTRTLLDAVTVGLAEGDRIGIVGRNGDGKSTLMRLLAGEATPDSGQVTRRGGLRVGYLHQGDAVPEDSSVAAVVAGGLEEHEWAADPRRRAVVEGLLGDIPWEGAAGTLSGGQRRRVALAALLVGDWDVLMLDEPTNHLDVEGVAWLAGHIANRWKPTEGGLLLVTHDRWFLDEVSTRTWEVHGARVASFDGGYAAYVLARAERERNEASAAAKRDNLIRKELAWLRRGAPARTTKPKFRIDAANQLIEQEPQPRDTVELAKTATARLGKDVVDLEDVSLEQGGRKLFDRVTWRVGPGERIGIVGVNGAGKTTLFRMLQGKVAPTSGRVKIGKTVQPALLSQNVTELEEFADRRAVEVVEAERRVFDVGAGEASAGQLLERLGFMGQRQWTPVGSLSGGERRKLQMLRLLVSGANLLMLDEPTNDLDTDTLAALEDLLDTWPGTLLVTSHDRYLLERVTDRQVALLGDGAVRDLPGGVEEYLKLRAGSGVDAPRVSMPDRDGGGAAGKKDSAAERSALKAMARIERRLEKLDVEEGEIHRRMGENSTNFPELGRLQVLLSGLAAEKERLEEEWMDAAQQAQ